VGAPNSTISKWERRLDEELAFRKADQSNSGLEFGKAFFALVVAALVVFFFSLRIGAYVNVFQRLDLREHVINLTKQNHQWDVFYGQSPKCGKLDCHLTADYSKDFFQQQMVLPAREFPLKGYKRGDLIFLRTSIPVDEFKNLNETLAVHSLYIWAKRFEFYANEKLIQTGGRETLMVPIPDTFLEGRSSLEISIKIDPGDLPYQGLANRHDLYIGPKRLMKRASFSSIEYKTTFYLWFLIPKLIFCLLFSLLYGIVYRHREMLYFLGYSVFSVSAVILLTSYYPESLERLIDGRVGYLVFDIFAQALLLIFIHEYFRRKSKVFTRFARSLIGGLIVVSSFLIFNDDFRAWASNHDLLFYVREMLRYTALLYGAVLGFGISLILRRNQKSVFRMYSTFSMGVFCAISLVTGFVGHVFSSAGNPFGIAALIFDLSIYFCFAGVVASEFGLAIRHKDLAKGALGRMLTPAIAEKMMNRSNRIEAKNIEAAVLFCDIRNFTQLSECVTPRTLVEILLVYRQSFSKIIKQNHGYVDKYIGDAIMAVWGVSEPPESISYSAFKTAVLFRRELKRINFEIERDFGVKIAIGVGIAVGEVVFGDFGSDEKGEASIVGDVVNTAAKLEKSAKELGVDIVLTESLLNSIADDVIVADCGLSSIQGKRHSLQLFQAIGYRLGDGKFECGGLKVREKGSILPGVVNNLVVYDYGARRPRSAA